MGSLFQSKAKAVSDPGAEAAWNIAAPSAAMANRLGQDFTQQVMSPDSSAYAGPRVAGLNEFQTQGANTLGSFSQNTAPLAGLATGLSGSLAASGATYGQNANQVFQQASMDPTGYVMDVAKQYANSPYATGMIDAANRDTQRMLTEQQLPSLARAAAGGGNTNSTRAGVESAILQRGAADRMADTAANIRGTLFNNGLSAGQSQWNQRLGNMMQANQGLLSGFQTGISGVQAGQDLASTAFNQSQAAGGVFQNQAQNEINGTKSYWDESFANRLAALQALSGIAANTQAKTTAGVTQTPSVASQLGSFMKVAL